MKPILFSTPMVQAILEGRKTMTRRIIKPTSKNGNCGIIVSKKIDGTVSEICGYDENENTYNEKGRQYPVNNKYEIGDILWVRETWVWEGNTKYLDMLSIGFFYYKADKMNNHCGIKWKPSIFMPKEAARIFLKVTDIRVEKVQDISEADAIAEGIEFNFFPDPIDLSLPPFKGYKIYGSKNAWDANPINSYWSLWDMINGKKSWLSNPWVWVIAFERIDQQYLPTGQS